MYTVESYNVLEYQDGILLYCNVLGVYGRSSKEIKAFASINYESYRGNNKTVINLFIINSINTETFQ